MTTSRIHRIAVVPGDGIGEEVVREGLRAMKLAAKMHGFGIQETMFPYGADHYLATGETLPESFFEGIHDRFEAILVGAIGDPRVETGFLEREIIAGIRFQLDLFINLRPVKLYAEHLCPLKGKKPEDIDFLVVRENTEDAYTGLGGVHRKDFPNEVAIAEMIWTRYGVERTIRYAFEACRKRNRDKKLTLVDKSNAIRAMDLWTRIFEEIGQEYPDIERSHAYVDACCMWMVKNPETFDTIVTSNLFGDIVTDLAAMLQGGLGVAAGANLHPGKLSMFEPIHGSAPKYRGKNRANPLATMGSCAMLLDQIGEEAAARSIEGAIQSLLRSRKIPSLSAKDGPGTKETGDLVLQEMEIRGPQPVS